MKITSINVKPVKSERDPKLLARVSMVIDNAVSLRGLRLRKKDDDSIVLLMAAQPRWDDPTKYMELFHPISAEARKALTDVAVDAYNKALTDADENGRYICNFPADDAKMEISSVRVYPTKSETAKSKAFVSLVLDDALVLHQLRVFERPDGLKIGMPNFRRKPNEKDGPVDMVNVYHPISAEARKVLEDAVVAAYKDTMAAKDAA